MDNTKYSTIILIKCTTHEVDSNNILSAKPVSKKSVLFDFSGETLEELQQKLDNFIKQIGELHAKETGQN